LNSRSARKQKKMAGKRRAMAVNALVFSLAALAAAFQFYGFLLSLLMMNTSAKVNFARI